MASRPQTSPLHPTVCAGCDALVWFATVSNSAGRPPSQMPLNARPDPAGNVAAYHDDKDVWRARVLPKGTQAAPHERVYMPHFATCPNPEAYRKRQRDDWRKAQADVNRDRRNRRGKRPSRQAAAIEQPGLFRSPCSWPSHRAAWKLSPISTGTW